MPIVLAILVIWPFLGDARATMISALAIPVSLLGTAVVMRLLHFNLETITLLALSLVVGVILDDAIVAVENIVRHVEAGELAARGGARCEQGNRTYLSRGFPDHRRRLLTDRAHARNAWPVLPAFRADRFGRGAFLAARRTDALADAGSDVVASPAKRTRPKPVDPNRTGRFQRYRHVLDWALGHRGVVVALAVGTVVAGLALIPFIPKGLHPASRSRRVSRDVPDLARDRSARDDRDRKETRRRHAHESGR